MTHPHIVSARKSITLLETALKRVKVDGFSGIKGCLDQIDKLIAVHGPYPNFAQELHVLSALVGQVNSATVRELSARIQSNVKLILARQRTFAQEDAHREAELAGYVEEVLKSLESLERRAG